MDELKLGPTARLRVIRSDAEVLEVEATYAPGSQAPPNHLHPDQDEHFEILEGAMQVQLDGGEERTVGKGETVEGDEYTRALEEYSDVFRLVF